MKRIQSLLIGCMILAVTASQGQETKREYGSWYFVNGFQFINAPALNNAIGPAGWPSVSATFTSGFGGYGEFKHWIIGGEGGYMNHSETSGNKITQSYGGLGYFYVGYKVVNTARWKIFPTLGLGLGGMTCVLTDAVGTGTTFNDVLTTQPNARSFDNGSFLLHSGLSTEYKFGRVFFAGLKTGYNFSLTGSRPWSALGLDENLSIKDAFSSYYVQIHFGIYFH